jgi:hypothetical protein
MKQVNPRKVKPILNEGIVQVWPDLCRHTDEELRDELARAGRDDERLLDPFEIERYLSASFSS